MKLIPMTWIKTKQYKMEKNEIIMRLDEIKMWWEHIKQD